jgi:hypothetical protein
VTSIPPVRGGGYDGGMDDEEVNAFVDAWLRDNAGVLDEMVALMGDDLRTPYGAALQAALAAMPNWKPDTQGS